MVLISSLILLNFIYNLASTTYGRHILLFVLHKKYFCIKVISVYHCFVMKNGKLFIIHFLYQLIFQAHLQDIA